MHISRQTLGGGLYYLCYMLTALVIIQLGFVELGFVFAILSLMVGLNNEALLYGHTYFTAITFAVGSCLSLSFLSTWLWALYSGFSFVDKVQIYLDKGIQQVQWPQETLKMLNQTDILIYVPSMVIFLSILSLVVSLLFEKKVSNWMHVRIPFRRSLIGFQVPEFVIWFFIFSLLGSFMKENAPLVWKISVNVLYVSTLAYFFQGLAVILKYFHVFRLSIFWRVTITLLLILYLPFLLSLIGVLDYWIHFRGDFIKRFIQIDKRRGP